MCVRHSASAGWFSLAITAVVAVAPSSASGEEWVVLSTTPPGVTLVEVVRDLPISSDQVLWTRLGDAGGWTLLFSHGDQPGVSNCAGDCAAEFPPLLAQDDDASAFGDWSLVRRADGQLQWAYQSRPLYTWSKEQEPGEVATNVGLAETASSKTASGPVEAGSLVPPAGWEVARFDPAASMPRPAGIEVGLVASARAVVLTDFAGRPLYTFAGDAPRGSQWLPVAASALALDVGDFSVVTRADGFRQWAYKEHPLYRHGGDLLPGDVRKPGVDVRWEVAALTTHFSPPDVAVTALEGYGDVLSLNGMTLYSGSAFEKYFGGRNLRDSFKVAYFRGKRLGGDACADVACLETWRPFSAPDGARSSGFWEVITRRDGTNQWAYKGFALYTYAGDTVPGQNRGQAIYAFTDPEGRSEDLERVALLARIGNAGGGAGVYWNIAKP